MIAHVGTGDRFEDFFVATLLSVLSNPAHRERVQAVLGPSPATDDLRHDQLPITPRKAALLCRTGQIQARRLGRVWLIKRQDWEAWLETQAKRPSVAEDAGARLGEALAQKGLRRGSGK